MSENIILGAGPAGLTAAYELDKLGANAVILEADNQVGGLSRTVSYKGFRFDIGGHRFFSKVDYINQIWHEILDQDLLVRPRLSRIYYRKHFFDYPLRPLNALVGLGVVEALKVGLSYMATRIRRSDDDSNFEQWVANRFGYRLYEVFFKTYTEKVWGMPCKEISADWAAQRIRNLSLLEAARNALFNSLRDRDDQIIATLIDQFEYPRLGPGMMWERCENVLARRGSVTLRGVRAQQIHHTNGRVQYVTALTESAKKEPFTGKEFISTIPLRELILSMVPDPPDEVLTAAHNLRYRDYLTVILIIDRAEVFPDNWIYIHSPGVKVGRIQNYKNWNRDVVPNQEQTSLGLEYFLWENDDEWHWSNEQLIELGIKECSQIGLISPDQVIDGAVVRMKKAYPIYDHTYQANLETIRLYLKNITNLQTIGRNGLHRYNNQDHSMLTGVYAARNIAGENHDVWTVNTEKQYLEEGTVAGTKMVDRKVPVSLQGKNASSVPREQVVERAFARLDGIALGAAVGLVSGLGLFMATAILLLKGGQPIGPNLSLLANYLIGFEVTWRGAIIGLLEGCVFGFVLGNTIAALRNWRLKAYAAKLQRQAKSKERKRLLEKI